MGTSGETKLIAVNPSYPAMDTTLVAGGRPPLPAGAIQHSATRKAKPVGTVGLFPMEGPTRAKLGKEQGADLCAWRAWNFSRVKRHTAMASGRGTF